MQFDANVAALEDKIVQRATVAVLNCIYEEEFVGFSYGFRPKRGQHDALDAVCVGITTRKVNFIFDADVRSFKLAFHIPGRTIVVACSRFRWF